MTESQAKKLIGRMFLVNLSHYKRPGKVFKIIGVSEHGVLCVQVPNGDGHQGTPSDWIAGNKSILTGSNAWWYKQSEGTILPKSIKLTENVVELKEEPKLFSFDDL